MKNLGTSIRGALALIALHAGPVGFVLYQVVGNR